MDATALAVGVEARSNDDGLGEFAQNFFNANYSENQIGAPGPIEVTAVDGVVRISGTARIDTTLLKLLDIDHIDVAAVSESNQNSGRLRVSR